MIITHKWLSYYLGSICFSQDVRVIMYVMFITRLSHYNDRVNGWSGRGWGKFVTH